MNHNNTTGGIVRDSICRLLGGGIVGYTIAEWGVIHLALCVLGCSSAEQVQRARAPIPGTGQRQEAATVSSDETHARIRPGDQIQIAVWGFPEFDTNGTVKETGTLAVPLLGEIPAAGLTKDEFTGQLKARLGEYVKDDPKVAVSVINVAGLKVSVMGAVTKQDNYAVMGEVPLVSLLLNAGGATPDADLRNVWIFRNGARHDCIEVDLTKSMAAGDMNAIPRVRPGDTVFVPRQENVVRVLSDFARDVLVVFGFFRIAY